MITQHVYKKWITLNRDFLEQCRGKYIAVTYSAGKDSSACMQLLRDAADEYGFELHAFLYAFPKHRYGPEFLAKISSFWEQAGIDIVFRDAKAEDTILEGEDNPCRPCQNLRKKDLINLFPHIGRKLDEIVIVSGHSLWDLAGYALNRFVSSELAASTKHAESFSKERLLEISQRFYPFLLMKGGYSVYRPMLFLNREEIMLVCREKSLPILEIPCRYSHRRPKKILGDYFERFGYQFEYNDVLEFAKKHIEIAGIEEIQHIAPEEYLTRRF